MNTGTDLISALRVEPQEEGRHRLFWLSWQLCPLLCLPLPFLKCEMWGRASSSPAPPPWKAAQGFGSSSCMKETTSSGPAWSEHQGWGSKTYAAGLCEGRAAWLGRAWKLKLRLLQSVLNWDFFWNSVIQGYEVYNIILSNGKKFAGTQVIALNRATPHQLKTHQNTR